MTQARPKAAPARADTSTSSAPASHARQKAGAGKAESEKAAARKVASPKPVGPKIRKEIFARLAAANPEPRSDLEYRDPYTLLVAVVLSAQATDAGVNKATRRLFALADTPEAMLALGEDHVREQIRTIGLYRAKAKNVIALSQILVEQYGGAVPPSRAALEALPGVGKKTAAVVVNIAFGEATIAVDTHIFRVAHRIPLAIAKTADAMEAALTPIVPAPYRRHAHHWLILHGRYICKARKPDCPRCPIIDLCRYSEKTSPT